MTTAPHTSHIDRELYLEAARRVIHATCYSKCEITHPHFNKDFYYHNEGKGRCYEECYNGKFAAHFGQTAAAKQNLKISFDRMKKEYKSYEQINPYHKYNSFIEEIPDLDKFEEKAEHLIEQTRRNNPHFSI